MPINNGAHLALRTLCSMFLGANQISGRKRPRKAKMKVAINKCFGGFGLSEAVFKELGFKWDGYGYLDNDSFGIKDDNYLAYRRNKKLIKAIEKVGEEKASGKMAMVRIVEIPNGVDWEINEYDGIETIHEKHRSW